MNYIVSLNVLFRSDEKNWRGFSKGAKLCMRLSASASSPPSSANATICLSREGAPMPESLRGPLSVTSALLDKANACASFDLVGSATFSKIMVKFESVATYESFASDYASLSNAAAPSSSSTTQPAGRRQGASSTTTTRARHASEHTPISPQSATTYSPLHRCGGWGSAN